MPKARRAAVTVPSGELPQIPARTGPQRLTALAVERIRPDPAKRLELPDALLTGLYLIVQPSGSRSFALRTRISGRSVKLTLGKWPAVTLEEARDRARAQLKSLDKGVDPRPQPVPEGDRITVAQAVEEFIARYARPRLKTWQEVEARLQRDFVAQLGTRPLASLHRRDIAAVLDRMADRGVEQGANRQLAYIRRLLSWHVERGTLDTNPALGIRPPAREQQRDRVLEDGELGDIWRAAPRLGYPFGPLVRLLVATGQRAGEVAAMRWHEIDLEAATWTLPASATKAARAHVVPLSDLAIDVLAGVPRFAGSPYVLSTTGETAPSGWSNAKERLDRIIAKARAEAAGDADDVERHVLAPWVLHDIRRTVATGLAKFGEAPHVISAVLNHAARTGLGVTATYLRHQYDREKRAALDAWGRHVRELVDPPPAADVLPLRRRARR